MGKWTLFSNHGHVLVCLVNDPESRLRDVAVQVGITERAVQKIVRDLQDVGMLGVTKDGRRNRYHIDTSKNLRHELESHCTVADLIGFVSKDEGEQTPADTESDVHPTVDQEPELAAKPEPEPEPEPELDPEPGPEPEPEPDPEIVTQPKPEPEPEPEPESEPENLIERQQGSLF
ncbi:MAG: hypothetical protein OQJ84_02675 [Xanthomonadales bacterium]|nr:hypothetical protein [Xanthomonadales bacterium]